MDPMRFDYRPRRIVPLDLHRADGWRLKRYSLLAEGRDTDEALVEAATDAALAFLPRPAAGEGRYGVGFVGVHRGDSYDFVTVAYWTYRTELRLQTFMRPSSASYRLEPIQAGELSMDVWDLALLAFERDAWLATALEPDEVDLEAYLTRRLDTDL